MSSTGYIIIKTKNRKEIGRNFPGHSVGSLWSPLSFINLLVFSKPRSCGKTEWSEVRKQATRD